MSHYPISAVAIEGATFGDESKGKHVDHYACPDSVVIRASGGANAGHTVVRDGVRHVFHHFGSGTLRGARTFLSRHFLSNPILFFQELDQLRQKGFEPDVTVDPSSPVTTPWDMHLNQMIEESRANARHGSCGVGINETIKRGEHEEFLLTVADLSYPREFPRDMFKLIQNKWVPQRLHDLGLEPSDEWMRHLDINGTSVIDKFVEYCDAYVRTVRVSGFKLRAQAGSDDPERIVFEGAQGLLLDQDHRFFPHVTHSRTGLKNVMELAGEIGINEMEVVYVTRAYATRHGAGPFPREVHGLRHQDDTNVPNDWQGTLRFGELDLDLLNEAIMDDAKHAVIPFRRTLAISHLDQVGPEVAFWNYGKRFEMPWQGMASIACGRVGADSCLVSFGPTAKNIRHFSPN